MHAEGPHHPPLTCIQLRLTDNPSAILQPVLQHSWQLVCMSVHLNVHVGSTTLALCYIPSLKQQYQIPKYTSL